MQLQKWFGIIVLSVMSSIVFAGTVDINTANAKTLAAELKGVGDDKAAAIVQYREKHGPFKSINELNKVDGIGEKTIKNNADKLSIGKPKE
ncbi:MAG: helix-hairpin-helix domain-containing protein [Gammaproteobacteria bacterium]|nr:helix-hairpin-helix domain-containing protein [Gammaproteobacteria bacterium]